MAYSLVSIVTTSLTHDSITLAAYTFAYLLVQIVPCGHTPPRKQQHAALTQSVPALTKKF